MTSRRQKIFNAMARYMQKPVLAHIPHQPTVNAIFGFTAELTQKSLKGTREKFANTEHCRIRRMIPKTASGNVLLYLHGGGFTIGGSNTHRWLASRLAAKIKAEAWLPDYRLAPAHPYPAAPEDCLNAYRKILETTPPNRIVIAGDSAGGTLTLNTVTRIAKAGLPQPAALALLSPLTDLNCTNPSNKTFAQSDMLLPTKWTDRCIPAYLNGADPSDPAISPIFADLTMAPPAITHAAEGEMLIDDARLIAKKLPEAQIKTWENVPHVWQLAAGMTPEADASITQMATFLNQHLP